MKRTIPATVAISAMMKPRAIAVFGVSEDADKLGTVACRNLIAGGYEGQVFPISRSLAQMDGLPCYRSVADVPAPVDLAFLAIPAEATVPTLRDCASAGVKVAIVGSAGFAESGENGSRRQAEVSAIASEDGIRVVGPNCNGIYSATNKLAMGFNTAHSRILPSGDIAIVSHSGALFDTMIGPLISAGIGISSFVSVGNEADLTILDYMEWMIEDPATRVVAMLVDYLSDADRFRRLADRARHLGKHIVVLKIGLSAAGAQAAEAHSSRLAGSAAAYMSLFKACGVPVVTSIESLITAAMLLSTYGRVEGGLAAFSSSGAGASLIADMCDRFGVPLVEYREESRVAAEAFRRFSKLGNPLDMGVFGGVGHARSVPSLLAADPGLGMMMALVHSMNPLQRSTYMNAFADALESSGKPFVIVTPNGLPAEESAQYREKGFLVLADTESAIQGIGAVLSQLRPYPSTAGAEPMAPAISPPAGPKGTRALTEVESLAMLEKFGIDVVETASCAGIDEAIAAAEAFGWPVVLKAVIEGVSHKSDAGLVRLGIAGPDALRLAYWDMGAPAQIAVQPLVKGKIEAIAGISRLPDLGAVLIAGLGGIYAEAIDDVLIWPVPVTRNDIVRDLTASTLGRILTSSRWGDARALDSIVETLMRLQALAVQGADWIEAVDVNPLIVSDRGVIAVDALIVPRSCVAAREMETVVAQ